MMDFITALASNPVPTSVAVLIAVGSLLAIYFIGIPMLEENRKLKKEVEGLRDRGSANDSKEIAEQFETIELAFTELREILKNDGRKWEEYHRQFHELVQAMEQHGSKAGNDHESLHAELDSIHTAISRQAELSQSFVVVSKAREEAIDRVLHDLNRNMQSMSEKHSQILGALMGMSRLQDRNRGI